MTQLTIKGEIFDVAEDPQIATLAIPDGMKHALQQVRRENIRNNFAKRVEEALANGGITPALHDELAKYAASYEFGVRQPGAPRVVRDPVEREAFKLIRSAISAAYRAKYNVAIPKETLDEKADELFELKGADYMKRAAKIVKERQDAEKSELGVAV